MKNNKNKKLSIAWAVLYGFCAAFGFIPTPDGVLMALMVTLSLAFFVPPAMLLYRAVPREDWQTIRRIRNLSILSLGSTMTMLILNFLSVGASAAVGNVLYWLLILVSAPMVCGQFWAVSLFLWACLLMVTIAQLNKRK